jgi:hypothetical protein
MKEYSAKEIKQLKTNPYTHNVTKNKVYFTAKFKEIFWIKYQGGDAPRKILADLGYEAGLFRQKQIDSIVQRIKSQALSGNGFREGENRTKRTGVKEPISRNDLPQSLEYMQHELLYLRQEIEFLKKIIKADNSKRGN